MPFAKDQLLSGEKLIHLRHQHFVVLLGPILIDSVATLLLVAVALLVHMYWLLLVLLAPAAHLGWKVLARQREEYVITSRRVVKQEGIFAIRSFDAPLDKINNVFHQQSVWGRILGFGDVGLETASEQGTTVFHLIPDPVGFKNSIVQQREAYKAPQPAPASAPASREDIPRLLDDLARLRDRKVITEAEFEAKKKDLLSRF